MTPLRHYWDTESVEGTRAIGKALGRSLAGGLTIGLVGPLGAGKTQLVKGIAAGNGLDDPDRVTSPTFTLVHEYPGRVLLYHVDAYRLHLATDVLALGFDEWTRPDSVVVIEWADRLGSVLPSETLWIELHPTGETTRRVTLRAEGRAATRCLHHMQTRVN